MPQATFKMCFLFSRKLHSLPSHNPGGSVEGRSKDRRHSFWGEELLLSCRAASRCNFLSRWDPLPWRRDCFALRGCRAPWTAAQSLCGSGLLRHAAGSSDTQGLPQICSSSCAQCPALAVSPYGIITYSEERPCTHLPSIATWNPLPPP